MAKNSKVRSKVRGRTAKTRVDQPNATKPEFAASARTQANRAAVGVAEFGGEQGRNPVVTHHLAHRSSTPDLANEVILLLAQHRIVSSL